MSTAESHAKNRGKKMSAADKKAARMAANRKARLQWYAVAAALTIIMITVIVLFTIFTEGEIAVPGGV